MKKNDLLKLSVLKPKRDTILLLLQFSKSLAVIKTKSKSYLVSKN